MQPTDYQSGRFSCSQGTEAARRNEREPGYLRKGLVDAMKSRVLRIAVILSSVIMTALAGGASLKPF